MGLNVVRKSAIIVAVLALSFVGLTHTQQKRVYGASNGRILYASFDSQSVEQIYSMNPDGSDVQQLTTGNFTHFDPISSPNGGTIAFVGDPNADGNYQLYTMYPDGSNMVNITNDTAITTNPAWSPDGSKIAVSRAPGSSTNANIYTMNPDGTGLTQLTHDSDADQNPSWNPTSSSLVFSCYLGAANQQLCTVSANGTGETSIASNVSTNYQWPAWSPNGTTIVFATSPHPYDYQLMSVHPDGSSLQTFPFFSYDSQTTSWSPDGSEIVIAGSSSTLGGTDQLYTMNADGSNQVQVSANGQSYFDASWAPVPSSDLDSDGSSNAVENAGPNHGDANGDSIPDEYQASVTSFVNSLTRTYNVLQSNCTNSGVSTESVPTAYPDRAFAYAATGLMNFTLHCATRGQTANITLYYYGLTPTSTMVVRKYNTRTHAYQTIPGATITAVTIGGQAALKVTYQITDGGPFDQDGSANGVIVDPVGIATPAVGVPDTGFGGRATSFTN